MASLFQNDNTLPTNITTTESKSNMKLPATNISTNNYVEKRFNNIIKSSHDKREYRGLILTNKMRVLLISDPTTNKSATSLCVNIGYLSDPDDLPGLAHFCEHMLFLGTEKYPEKNEYNKYLAQHGGSFNGTTLMDATKYYFDVQAENLGGALDRFAQFFIAPLFTEALTELELNAIHSEHEKNLSNDTWHINQLEKSSCDPKHPFSKFGTGNKETLDVIPKQKGINIRERLFEFHKKYYSSNIMSLCVLGKEGLNELEEMVVELFSQIENKKIELPVWLEHPFNEEHFKHKWYIVPIKDMRYLYIIFPIPDLNEHYKAAPAHYISNLLGHEGEGSLLSALRARRWSNALEAGRRLGARGFQFFVVCIELTEEGIQHVDDIVLLTFQYINMLKKHGPVEWIYNEYRDIAKMNFQFKEKCSPIDYVSILSQILQVYPIEDTLTVDNLFPEWKPDLIEQMMKYLKPENVRIHVIGKIYESIADETEKWHGTKFKKEKIPEDIINMWVNAGLDSSLQLPPKNEFIAEKYEIKPAEKNITKFPVIIEDTPLLRLWFKQDDEFLVPRVNLTVDFVCLLAYIDPLSYNLTCMFVLLFRDSLNEYSYAANLAGLRWEMKNKKYGISLGIGGYDDKQHVLLEKIMDKMVNFKVDPKRFDIFKENYIRSLRNFEAEQPYQHAVYYLAVLLSEHVWTKEELLNATSELSAEKLQQFIPQFLSKVHLECLIHGNMIMSEAISTARLIESKLSSSFHLVPLLPRQLILYREIKLEDGCHFLFEVENKYHKNSCTQVYYPIGLQSTESNILLELIAQIISEPCFTELRTKEQLGYIVYSGVRRTNGAQGLRVIVQSDKDPKYVEQKINAFLNSMLETISSMSEEEFNRHVESLAVLRLEKPKQMTSLTEVFLSEIATQQYNFDRANIEVAHLRTIKKEQILKFYEDLLQSNVQSKLSVHVISTVKDSELTEENTVEPEEESESANATDAVEYKKIDDIISFKISQSLYPLVKPFDDTPRKGAHSSKL